jgi:putative DNA-invertase from lambdoid prophage Rac
VHPSAYERLHEAEQEAICTMIAMRREGAALRPIAAAMAERGFKISHEAVKQIMAAYSDVTA